MANDAYDDVHRGRQSSMSYLLLLLVPGGITTSVSSMDHLHTWRLTAENVVVHIGDNIL